MMCRAIVASLMGAIIATAPASSAAQQRDPEEYAKALERAERVTRLQVPRVVEALKIEPGMRVVDLGAGSGVLTRPMARAAAPGGVVYAVDIDDGLLAIVARSARAESIDNVRTVRIAPDDPTFPEPADLVLICDTLHHVANQGPYLNRLRQSVKPGGRVAVIDYRDSWPAGHESLMFTEAHVDAWMREAGFQRVESHEFLDGLFFAVYR